MECNEEIWSQFLNARILKILRAVLNRRGRILTQKPEQSTAGIMSFKSIVKTPYDIMSSWWLSTAENHSNPEEIYNKY